jgi:hypothetical protein
MIINLKLDSTSSMAHKKVIFDVILELVESYHVGGSTKGNALHFFQDSEEGKQLVVNRLKEKYGLTAYPYALGHPENIFSEGYDIVEDEYLVKFLLTL